LPLPAASKALPILSGGGSLNRARVAHDRKGVSARP
jgi:hypothetical protein